MNAQNALSEAEIIAQARADLGEPVETLLGALEAFYMHGFHDGTAGDVETGLHAYRVHRWIVYTDDQGFHEINTYDSEAEAQAELDRHAEESAGLEIDNPGRDDDPDYAMRLEILEGPSQEIDAEGWEHYAYRVRLHYDGRSMDSDWRQGLALMEDPRAEDVLSAMLSDASSADNARSFEDWAADYGYDPDSRRAERIFHAVETQTAALRDLLGSEYQRAVFPTDYADSEEASRRLVRSGRVA